MAKGTITQVDTSTTGRVTVDDNEGDTRVANGTNIPYEDSTLPAKGGVVVNDKVSFTIEPAGPGLFKATNLIKQVVADPDFPATNEGDLYVPVAGDLDINGRTVTVRGTTVNGNVNITNGKLVLTSTAQDGAQRARITGKIDAKQNSNLVIYKSDVNGDIDFKDGSLDMTINNGSVGGDVQFKDSRNGTINNGSVGGDVQLKSSTNITVNNGSVGGDVQIKDNSTAGVVGADAANPVKVTGNLIVKDNTSSTTLTNILAGNVDVKNNTGCKYKNVNVVPGGSSKISGCNPA